MYAIMSPIFMWKAETCLAPTQTITTTVRFMISIMMGIISIIARFTKQAGFRQIPVSPVKAFPLKILCVESPDN
jgi:hypothetical protein